MQQLDVLVAEVAPQLFSNILSLAEAHFGELSIYFISHVVLRLMVWYASWAGWRFRSLADNRDTLKQIYFYRKWNGMHFRLSSYAKASPGIQYR